MCCRTIFLVASSFKTFVRQVERRVVTNNTDGKADLPVRLRKRLTLLLGQQPRELVLSCFERVGQPDQKRTALANRLGRPGGERCLGGRDRLVKLRTIGARRLREHFLGRGIDDIKPCGARHQFAVDK